MAKHRVVSPAIEQWPSWFGRLGIPESWQQFLDAEAIKVEEYRDGDEVVIRAEIPGVDPNKDVDVTVQDGMLCIHAERSQESSTAEGDEGEREHYRSEFRYGSFTRVVPLPAGVTEAEVSATYRDGILEVRAPTKSEQTRAHKIEISHR